MKYYTHSLMTSLLGQLTSLLRQLTSLLGQLTYLLSQLISLLGQLTPVQVISVISCGVLSFGVCLVRSVNSIFFK